MKLNTITRFFVFLALLLTLYPSTSVFAAQESSVNNVNIPKAAYIRIREQSEYKLQMTAANTGIFHFAIFDRNNVDITSIVPASNISMKAFVEAGELFGGLNRRRAAVDFDTLTGIATVTWDFSDSDKRVFIDFTYNTNPSLKSFSMDDLIMENCTLSIYDPLTYDETAEMSKYADITFSSDYLTDTGNNTATFKYKASYYGKDITKAFPTSLIDASTSLYGSESIDSSIDFDPSTGTGTIKFNSPVTDKIIRTTLSHKLTGATSVLNSGLGKDPIKRQAPSEVSKINFVTGSIVKTDKDTSTFNYKILGHDNSNITKIIPAADINATALIGSAKADVSLNPSTGTGIIKYNFTDNDKKARVTLTHKAGVEISAALNIVESESINDNNANDNDLQVARIVFLPTGMYMDSGHRAGLSYRIYNQYDKDITKQTPASNLAFSSSVNSMIYLFRFGIGETHIEYNTYDSNRTIIVSIMDKASGVKAAMNIGKPPTLDTDSPSSDRVIKFNDAALEQAIRDLLYKPTADITENDIKDITHISIGKGCTDLSGIENLKNLGSLELWSNNINSLSPLKQLPNLRILKYNVDTINDIKTLTELTNLQLLDITGVKISDEDLSSIMKALPKWFILH